jgi:hypothetical protein
MGPLNVCSILAHHPQNTFHCFVTMRLPHCIHDTLAMDSKITARNSGKLYPNTTETGFMKVNDPPNMPGAFLWSLSLTSDGEKVQSLISPPAATYSRFT